MGEVEIIREQMTPLIRQLAHRARAVHMASRPKESSRAIAYDIASLHAAAAAFMSSMPNAEGYALLVTNLQMIGDRWAPLAQVVTSPNEH